MTWYEILIAFISAFGAFKLGDFLTLRSQQKRAAAEADSAGIDNAQKIVNMWEKLADKKAKADSEQIASLNSRILDLENLVKSFQKTVDKFTKAINKARECPGADNCLALKELEKTTQDEK
jgi:hypothetical protein